MKTDVYPEIETRPVSPRMLLRADYLHVEFDERLNISGVATSGIFDANDGNSVKLKNVDMIRFGLDFMIGGLWLFAVRIELPTN